MMTGVNLVHVPYRGALFRGPPLDMLRPEHYQQWKAIEITFDPRDMIRG